MKQYKVPIQSLIDHIKTAMDVDPWAKEMAADLLKEQEAKPPVHKKTIYHRGYVIEWIEHMNSWRIYREEAKAYTIAYEDDPEEAVRRLDEEDLDLYCESADGIEIEYCNVCENEIRLHWHINRDGFQAYCPVCGSCLMLCDACTHRHGEAHDDCDWNDKEYCRFRRPDDWWKGA